MNDKGPIEASRSVESSSVEEDKSEPIDENMEASAAASPPPAQAQPAWAPSHRESLGLRPPRPPAPAKQPAARRAPSANKERKRKRGTRTTFTRGSVLAVFEPFYKKDFQLAMVSPLPLTVSYESESIRTRLTLLSWTYTAAAKVMTKTAAHTCYRKGDCCVSETL